MEIHVFFMSCNFFCSVPILPFPYIHDPILPFPYISTPILILIFPYIHDPILPFPYISTPILILIFPYIHDPNPILPFPYIHDSIPILPFPFCVGIDVNNVIILTCVKIVFGLEVQHMVMTDPNIIWRNTV